MQVLPFLVRSVGQHEYRILFPTLGINDSVLTLNDPVRQAFLKANLRCYPDSIHVGLELSTIEEFQTLGKRVTRSDLEVLLPYSAPQRPEFFLPRLRDILRASLFPKKYAILAHEVAAKSLKPIMDAVSSGTTKLYFVDQILNSYSAHVTNNALDLKGFDRGIRLEGGISKAVLQSFNPSGFVTTRTLSSTEKRNLELAPINPARHPEVILEVKEFI